MGKGATKERELKDAFQSAGWFAKRAGASGGGGNDESYDVIAAKDGRILVIELKYRDPDAYIYLDAHEIEELQFVATQLDAEAVIGARWKQDTTFYAHNPANCYRTKGGNYRLSAEDKDTAAFTLPPS